MVAIYEADALLQAGDLPSATRLLRATRSQARRW